MTIILRTISALFFGAAVCVANAFAGGHSQSIQLTATLTAPNQNGTNPEFQDNSFGIVPTDATGTFTAVLEPGHSSLKDIVLDIRGMKIADLKNFGPNSTPFHIHLPNSGKQGDFGFNVIDLFHGATEDSLIDTDEGFRFTREKLSILEQDQGNYVKAGVHPGDDKIVELLMDGFPFVLVHSNKAIFTNTVGKFPNGKPVPEGFPFGELRGELLIKK